MAGSNYTVGGINVTGVSTLSGLSYSGISSIADLKSDFESFCSSLHFVD